MAAIGLKMLYTGLKDDSGKTLKGDEGLNEKGVYEVDTNKANGNLGTRTANITGMSGTVAKIMGNNQVVDVTKPDAAPSVAIDSNAINHTVKEKLLGKKLVNGGWVDQSKPVDAGLIIESQSPITMQSVFFAFGRGNFTEASQNIRTNTDTTQTREDDNLTFTALGYTGFGGKAMKTYYEGDDGFSLKSMFDEVFPDNDYTTGMTDNPAGGSNAGSGNSSAGSGSSSASGSGTGGSNASGSGAAA